MLIRTQGSPAPHLLCPGQQCIRPGHQALFLLHCQLLPLHGHGHAPRLQQPQAALLQPLPVLLLQPKTWPEACGVRCLRLLLPWATGWLRSLPTWAPLWRLGVLVTAQACMPWQ